MKLEQQVCNSGLASRLKELEVRQESYFYWKSDGGEPYLVAHNSRYMQSAGVIEASAFTVAELGELLLPFITKSGRRMQLVSSKRQTPEPYWEIDYITPEWDGLVGDDRMKDAIEANARAKILIYLLENNLAAV